MKFSVGLNMHRTDPSQDMRQVLHDYRDLLQIAEQGGMEVAWAAEHHCIELTIAPNPFILLTDWAAHTSKIRLGVGVVVAAYWHPIRLAEEAAMTDLYCDGRLELGLARGAFQYEFDRMSDGLTPEIGRSYLFEALPLLRKLWGGDVAHEGEHWQFPKATSVPKPVQQPGPPLWVAARDPSSFDYAVKNDINIMSTPLAKPIGEVENLSGKLATALGENPGCARPRWMVARTTGVADTFEETEGMVDASIEFGRRFEGLFSTSGTVENGFPQLEDVQAGAIGGHTRDAVRTAMVVGTPEDVVEQLKAYEALGVDSYCYNSNYDHDPVRTRRSLELFVERVMPHFAHTS
jgi:alkanesulfonate monooxygenase SsuD/methylene tetrahydromethanopterin reductase-like flavin-dependent oxidoreductase (luciferase family)